MSLGSVVTMVFILPGKHIPDFRYYWMLEDDLRIDGDAAEFLSVFFFSAPY